MNFFKEVQDGQAGLNRGVSMFSSIFNVKIGGLNSAYYALGGESKSGKTALAVQEFLLGPYLHATNQPIKYIWQSTEMTRIEMEAGIVSFLAYHFEEQTIDTDLILGRKLDDRGNLVRMSPAQVQLVMEMYIDHVIPIMGRYDEHGVKTEQGRVHFLDYKQNPTGMRNEIVNFMEHKDRGIIKTKVIEGRTIKTSYEKIDKQEKVFVVIDHIRGLKHERQYNKKQNVDKMSEYIVDLRNLYQCGFLVLCHLNRSNADVQRAKYLGENIYPDDSTWKDTGNIAEDCNFMLNIFDPTDPKYGLNRHMGVDLAPYQVPGSPAYRTLHLIRARSGTGCPAHFAFQFKGAEKHFTHLTGVQESITG